TEMFKLVMVVNNGEIIWKDRNRPNWLDMDSKNK
ncbi:ATPase, partial [Clostridium sp. cpc1]|nr:ATPase [Clostridium sp. cpc1]